MANNTYAKWDNLLPNQLVFALIPFWVIVIITGLVGNVLIFISITGNSEKLWKSHRYIFYASSCVNDFLFVGCDYILVFASIVARDFVLRDSFCQVQPYLFNLFFSSMLWHKAFVTAQEVSNDTYTRCLSWLTQTPWKITALCLARLLPLTLLFSLAIDRNQVMEYRKHQFCCVFKVGDFNFYIVHLIINILLPALLTAISCFAIIILQTRRRQRSSTFTLTKSFSSRLPTIASGYQFVWTNGTAFLFIILGYVPYVTLKLSDSEHSGSPGTYLALKTMMYFFLGIQPLFYIFLDKKIKRAVFSIIRCRQQKSENIQIEAGVDESIDTDSRQASRRAESTESYVLMVRPSGSRGKSMEGTHTPIHKEQSRVWASFKATSIEGLVAFNPLGVYPPPRSGIKVKMKESEV